MPSAGLFKAPAIEPDLRGLVMVRLPTGGEVVTPLCSSTHAAACWSSSTFAGQRPDALPILHASMLIAPVPCVRTFLATVFAARGLRARTIGSNAGLSAVPQPSHCAASGVIGSSLATLTVFTPSAFAVAIQCVARPPYSTLHALAPLPVGISLLFGLSAPSVRSISFETL